MKLNQIKDVHSSLIPILKQKKCLKTYTINYFCLFLGMTMEDIRALEDKTKDELEKQRSSGEVRGTKPI